MRSGRVTSRPLRRAFRPPRVGSSSACAAIGWGSPNAQAPSSRATTVRLSALLATLHVQTRLPGHSVVQRWSTVPCPRMFRRLRRRRTARPPGLGRERAASAGQFDLLSQPESTGSGGVLVIFCREEGRRHFYLSRPPTRTRFRFDFGVVHLKRCDGHALDEQPRETWQTRGTFLDTNGTCTLFRLPSFATRRTASSGAPTSGKACERAGPSSKERLFAIAAPLEPSVAIGGGGAAGEMGGDNVGGGGVRGGGGDCEITIEGGGGCWSTQ